ncbi:MAG TPA: host attachment family protein [Steroidobacteraceae bacterium]|nr:host attachment family protein [Steroidobacteraceae bacterium]
MNIPNEALVVVGDGRKALFLRNRGTPANPELVYEDEMEHTNAPTRELGTDRPGRKHGADGVSRSAIEETDQHDRAEQQFAHAVADTLYKMGHADKFRAVVVVAPPRALGHLRAALHPEVTQRLVGEVAKDLVAHTLPDISKHLS